MASAPSRQSLTRPLVLLVDDYDDTLAMYALALSAMGFDVMTAKGNEEASSQASVTRPDVIVTEMAPPQTNGWEFLGHTKGDPRTDGIPVVVVTGYCQPSVRERAAREGCAAFFTKPCLPEELALALWHVVDGQRSPKAASH